MDKVPEPSFGMGSKSAAASSSKINIDDEVDDDDGLLIKLEATEFLDTNTDNTQINYALEEHSFDNDEMCEENDDEFVLSTTKPKGTRKNIAKHQKIRLVELMQAYPSLRKGERCRSSAETWKRIADELNAIDGSVKTWSAWRQHWAYWKSDVLRKKANSSATLKAHDLQVLRIVDSAAIQLTNTNLPHNHNEFNDYQADLNPIQSEDLQTMIIKVEPEQVLKQEFNIFDNDVKEECLIELIDNIMEPNDMGGAVIKEEIEEEDYIETKSSLSLQTVKFVKEKKLTKIQSFHEKKRKFFDNYVVRLCCVCGMEFEKALKCVEHQNNVHQFNTLEGMNYLDIGDNKVQCTVCNVKAKRKSVSNLRVHALTHQPFHAFIKCKICGRSASQETFMRLHIERDHFDVIGVALVPLMEELSEKNCIYCGKYCGMYKKLYAHIQLEHNQIAQRKLLYVCPICGNEYADQKTWKRHTLHKHQFHTIEGISFEKISLVPKNAEQSLPVVETDANYQYRCLKCDTRIPGGSRFNDLTIHANVRHHPYKLYKCRFCDFTNTRRTAVMSHTCEGLMREMAQNPDQIRQRDDVAGRKNAQLSRVIDLTDKVYVCPSCGAEFDEPDMWKEHLSQVHQFDKVDNLNVRAAEGANGRIIYICTVCDMEILQKSIPNMRAHAFKHMPYRQYKCKICCAGLNTLDTCPCKQLELSGRYLHIPMAYVCPSCGLEFATGSDWNEHLVKEHDLRNPVNLNFTKLTKDTENSSTIYKCNNCTKQLKDVVDAEAAMFMHLIAEHMPHKPYKCNSCFVVYGNKHHMLEHGIKHTKRKLKTKADPEKEDDGVQFEQNWQLCCTLIKWQCPQCDIDGTNMEECDFEKHFEDIHGLNTADKLHFETNANGSSVCLKCDQVFNEVDTLETLRAHYFEHEKLNSWCCLRCPQQYLSKTQLLAHIMQQHMENKAVRDYSALLLFHCPVCDEQFEDLIDWRLHLNKLHAFDKLEGLRMTLESPDGGYKCLDCATIVPSMHRTLLHRLEHFTHHAYKCRFCDIRITRRSYAYLHALRCQQEHKAKLKIEAAEARKQKALLPKVPKPKPKKKKKRKAETPPPGVTDPLPPMNKKKKKKRKTENSPPVPLPNVQYGLVVTDPLPPNESPTCMDPLQLDMNNPGANISGANISGLIQTTMATCSTKTTALNEFYALITYACPACNEPLATQQEWHLHISTQHDFFEPQQLGIQPVVGEKFKWKCDECQVIVHGSQLHLQRHKLTHMLYGSFVCTVCLHRSKTQNVLINHIRRRHFTPGEFKCPICSYVCGTFYERFAHTKSQHANVEWPDYVCKICVSMVKPRSMPDHMKTHAYDREFYDCGYCSRRYKGPRDRELHWQHVHPVEYAVQLQQQPKVEEEEKELTNEMETTTKPSRKRISDDKAPKSNRRRTIEVAD